MNTLNSFHFNGVNDFRTIKNIFTLLTFLTNKFKSAVYKIRNNGLKTEYFMIITKTAKKSLFQNYYKINCDC